MIVIMKLTALCGILLVLFTKIEAEEYDLMDEDLSTEDENNSTVQTEWIEQKLDHFDENENRTWKMRYMSNDEFFQGGSPAFIFVGGEQAIENSYVIGGHIYDMAKEHHGYLFYTEHRFYGESHPTSDVSTENLKYLTVKQALADLAHFIRTMKATIPGMAKSKFILAGASYPGAMVTWFKKLYPDLAVGCWASSAPLLIKVNFKEYMEQAGEAIRKVGGVDCYNRIHNAIKKLESMIVDKRGTEIKNKLKLCDSFNVTNELDVLSLFSQISTDLSGVVQDHSNDTIQESCKKIIEGADDTNGLVNYILEEYEEGCKNLEEGNIDETEVESYHTEFCEKGCTDLSYKISLEEMKKTTYRNSTDRQWFYQTCNELANFQSLDSKKQPFGSMSPVKFYTDMCKDVFGEQFTEEYIYKQVQATNDYFGGLEPNVTNVYFTHGELDPWRLLGIQDSRATIIPMYSHSADFESISESDTDEMRASKERIAQLVREWVHGSDSYVKTDKKK